MKFNLLLEHYLSNFTYHNTKDIRLQVFDFYMLEFLDKGPDVEGQEWRKGNLDETEEDQKVIDKVKHILLPYLREHFLRALAELLSAEAFDMLIFEEDEIFSKANKVYKLFLKNKNSVEYQFNMLKIIGPVITEEWGTTDEILPGFGVSPEANMLDSWYKLYESSFKELYIWIDHVYDLMHNTDSIFVGLKKYADKSETGEDVDWLLNILSIKANLKTPFELLPGCSYDMKKLANYILRKKGWILKNV